MSKTRFAKICFSLSYFGRKQIDNKEAHVKIQLPISFIRETLLKEPLEK